MAYLISKNLFNLLHIEREFDTPLRLIWLTKFVTYVIRIS